MIKFLFRAAIAASLASMPLGASALTYTVTNSSSNINNTNQADVFGAGFFANLGGASWVSGAAAKTITPPPANDPGDFLSPWANTPVAENKARTYFSVQPVAATTPATPDPAKLSVGPGKYLFTLLWGSIDIENKIEFRSGGSSVGSVTGKQLVGDTGNGATLAGCGPLVSNSYGCVAKVKFSSNVAFDQIWFHSGKLANLGPDGKGRNSFEFATPAGISIATVPLPAAVWLLLGVTGALVAAKRRSALRAA